MGNDITALERDVHVAELKVRLGMALASLSELNMDKVQKGALVFKAISLAGNVELVKSVEEDGKITILDPQPMVSSLKGMDINEYYNHEILERGYFTYTKPNDKKKAKATINFAKATILHWDKTVDKVLKGDGGGVHTLEAFISALDNKKSQGNKDICDLASDNLRYLQTVSMQKAAKYLTYVGKLFGAEGSLDGPVRPKEVEDVLRNAKNIYKLSSKVIILCRNMYELSTVRKKGSKDFPTNYLRVDAEVFLNLTYTILEEIGKVRMDKGLYKSAPAEWGYKLPEICSEILKLIAPKNVHRYTWSPAPLVQQLDGSYAPYKCLDTSTNEYKDMCFPTIDGKEYDTVKQIYKAADSNMQNMRYMFPQDPKITHVRISIYDTSIENGHKLIEAYERPLPKLKEPEEQTVLINQVD